MRLSKIAIDNYQFTLIVFIVLLFAGIQSYISMPRTENPEIHLTTRNMTFYDVFIRGNVKFVKNKLLGN